MAEETPSGEERSEAPSAKRRSDFRQKGQVAQSKEVQTAVLFSFMLLFWYFYAPVFLQKISRLSRHIWDNSGQFEINHSSLMVLLVFLLRQLGELMAPVFILAIAVGVLASFLQIGWNFTGQPLIPNFSKLNPIQGMSQFFSKRSFVELAKSLFKVLLVSWVAFRTIQDHFGSALLLGEMSLQQALLFFGQTASLVMAKICGVMIILAILDFAFVKYEMEEKMKMTKQELKEEMKETEGDPHVKARIRSIQQAMARRRMMAAVPKADVIITNPTHVAVALQYISGQMDAPMVIAKGQELVAEKIKAIGREHDIPVVENPPVARLLHSQVEIGETIPAELFRAVAEILAHVYSLKDNGRRRNNR